MLLDATAQPDRLQEVGLRKWENEHWAIFWKGFLFTAGRPAGTPTIEYLARRLMVSELRELCHALRGVFGLFAFDKRVQTWQIAADNAGLYRIYHNDRSVGTSFLEMLAATSMSAEDLDPAAVVSYLTCGYVFGADTLAGGIKKLRADQVLELDGGTGTPRLAQKALAEPTTDATTTVSEYFANLATAVRGRRLSVDATGGFDTRLIIGLLHHHHVEFEMAVSSQSHSSDKIIAEKMAKMLHHQFVATGHDIQNLEEDLFATFCDADGQADLRHFHRNRQNVLQRRNRGIEVLAHGGGGEVFRDYFYVHDFPSYGSSSSNFDRFYDLRFASVRVPEQHLGRAYQPLVVACRNQTIRHFEKYRGDTNNVSFKRAAYFLRAPEFFGPFFSSYINLGVEVIAPFLDHDVALTGIHLSPWQGFYNRWHRAMITRYNPALAALPTSEGYTASARTSHLARDLWSYSVVQASRVGKKIGQRTLGKTLFHRVGALAADAPGYADHLRQTNEFATAVDRLKSAGILATGLDPSELREAHIGRILTLGLLLGYLEALPDSAPGLLANAGRGTVASLRVGSAGSAG